MSTSRSASTEDSLSGGMIALNDLSERSFRETMRSCCGSKAFALGMQKHRPFRDLEELFATARLVWNGLTTEDWIEAYSSHPRIGERRACSHGRPKSDRWSRGEQSGVAGADKKVLRELRELNEEYERRHGFVFLVCATGKGAEEILNMMKVRVRHDTVQEVFEAANEQVLITEIRMRKVLQELEAADSE